MKTAEITIEILDKEYLVFVSRQPVFVSRQPTGMPSDPTIAFGPVNYVHRYVIKIEDAKKMLRFLLEADDENT